MRRCAGQHLGEAHICDLGPAALCQQHVLQQEGMARKECNIKGADAAGLRGVSRSVRHVAALPSSHQGASRREDSMRAWAHGRQPTAVCAGARWAATQPALSIDACCALLLAYQGLEVQVQDVVAVQVVQAKRDFQCDLGAAAPEEQTRTALNAGTAKGAKGHRGPSCALPSCTASHSTPHSKLNRATFMRCL